MGGLKKITKKNFLPTTNLGMVPVYAEKLNEVIDEISGQNEVIALTGDYTLTDQDYGKTITVNNAAGLTVTLPSTKTENIGKSFKFLVLTTITSNTFGIDTAATSDLFYGTVTIHDKDNNANDSYFVPDGSDDDSYDANGGTKGGMAGDVLTVTCIAANKWFVEGYTRGDGTLATPFS